MGIPTPTEKRVLQKAGLGFKKINFNLKADEVSVQNQLTSSNSANSEPDELSSDCSQLQNFGGFELIICIPNCKVLEPLECHMSATIMKTATGQGKIYIRPMQRSLSALPLKSEASPCSTSALKGKVCIRSTLSMYFTPMCCRAYLPIICYQMAVMKVVTLSRTIAALKF